MIAPTNYAAMSKAALIDIIETQKRRLQCVDNVICLDNKVVSPGEKLMLMVAPGLLAHEKPDERGLVCFPVGKAAEKIGMSESSGSRYLASMTERFHARREHIPYTTKKGQECILTYIDPSEPLWVEPWTTELAEENLRTINGNECPHCHSSTLRIKKRTTTYQEIRECDTCKYRKVSKVLVANDPLEPMEYFPPKKGVQAEEPFGGNVPGAEKLENAGILTADTGVVSAPGEISKKGLQPEEPFSPPAPSLPPEWLRKKTIWCPWRYEPHKNHLGDIVPGAKPDKVPYQTRGRDPQKAKSSMPETWSSYEVASATYQEYLGYKYPYDGIGLMCDGSFVGIDLDHCRDKETGEWFDWAEEIVARFTSYSYITPSREGLRIIIRAKKPGGHCKKGNIEIYEEKRFFTWTPMSCYGTPDEVQECQAELEAFYRNVWPEEEEPAPRAQPAECSDEELDDPALQRILEKARNGKNGARFVPLYDAGQWGELGYQSQSEADAALCNELAYWTDNNVSAIDRLFRKSALMRPKWDEKARSGETYGEGTIARCLVKKRKERAA